nr:cupin domain-containing protein [Acidobacteriota bacterium]
MQRNVFALVIGAASMAGMGSGFAQSAAPAQTAKPAAHVMVAADEVKWGPGPPALPPGAQAAALDGDPAKSGIFVIRLKFPDGYRVPPHSHPTDEHVTVISGTVAAGFGDRADDTAMHVLTAGGYAKMPAGENHYVRAKGESIVQIVGMGPFVVKYVNQADDPRT